MSTVKNMRKKIPNKEREQMLQGAIANLIYKNNSLYSFLHDIYWHPDISEGVSKMLVESEHWEEIKKYDLD